MKPTVINLARLVKNDDDEQTGAYQTLKYFIVDEPFPVNKVFVAEGRTYTFSGSVVDTGSNIQMLYVEADPEVVDDRIQDMPHTGIVLDMRTGEFSNWREEGSIQ